ncbi:efflux RND transporter periplasmic adaptor subunit [Pirellulaceae bacterium SH501]
MVFLVHIVIAFQSCFHCVGLSILEQKDELVIYPVLLRALEEAEVPALHDGSIDKIVIKEGGTVNEGDVLIQMDQRYEQFKRDQSALQAKIAELKATDKSSIQLSETEVEVANAALQRAIESRKRFPDTPSQAELDQLRLRLAEAVQHLERAKQDHELAILTSQLASSSLQAAELELDRCRIRTPIAGSVVEIIARPGEWVKQGSPVARVIQLKKLRAEAVVTREQAASLSPGAPIKILLPEGMSEEPGADRSKEFTATIVFISPEVDRNDDRKRIVAEVDNTRMILAPGMRVALRLPQSLSGQPSDIKKPK